MAPHVVIHNAVSVDGRIDGFVPEISLYYELAGTWDVDAHLVGADTLIESGAATGPEDPDSAETGSEGAGSDSKPRGKPPRLVVSDSRGRVTNWNAIQEQPFWSDVLVLCSETTPEEYLDGLDANGIAYQIIGDDHVDLGAALAQLDDRGVETVLVDSGGTLNGHLLVAGLVDEVSVLVHPALVGGTSARAFVRGPDPEDGATSLELVSVDELDGDLVWLRYAVPKDGRGVA